MTYTEKAKQKVRDFAKKKKWSVLRLANHAGVPCSTIRDIHKPEWNPYCSTLEKLEQAISNNKNN